MIRELIKLQWLFCWYQMILQIIYIRIKSPLLVITESKMMVTMERQREYKCWSKCPGKWIQTAKMQEHINDDRMRRKLKPTKNPWSPRANIELFFLIYMYIHVWVNSIFGWLHFDTLRFSFFLVCAYFMSSA